MIEMPKKINMLDSKSLKGTQKSPFMIYNILKVF